MILKIFLMLLPVSNNSVTQQPPPQQFAPEFSRNTDGYGFHRRTGSLPFFKFHVKMKNLCNEFCLFRPRVRPNDGFPLPTGDGRDKQAARAKNQSYQEELKRQVLL